MEKGRFRPMEVALSKEMDGLIPERWYEERSLEFVCRRCRKTFKKAYRSRSARRGKEIHGANVLSLWAWHNFKRHLLRCWGRNATKEAVL